MNKLGKYFVVLIVLLVCIILFIRSDMAIDRGTSVDLSSGSFCILEETAKLLESVDQNWWLDSGGKVFFEDGTGEIMTIAGPLQKDDLWRKIYAKSNPVDTDNGYYPQNIFRLVNKGNWRNMTQEAHFKIESDNPSSSPNRNESNGLLFFNRYVDGDNLYYAGLRVDGAVVIKKKLNGEYYTLAYEKVFPGIYNSSSTPNLLPHGVWIGLRVNMFTTDFGVVIELYLKKDESWIKVAQAVDDGSLYGSIIDDSAHAGIRTDFMDVRIKDYSVVAN